MDFLNAKGMVVGETAVNEGDKMLTIYTDKFGLINAKAPGAKSLKRKDMAGINMFAYGDYILTKNKQYYTVRECNIITHFFDVKKDIFSFAVGCYILEAVKLTGNYEMPDEEILRLSLNCLYALANKLHSPLTVKAAFELRLCLILGVVPDMTNCMYCGEEIKDDIFYDLSNDILSCNSCTSSQSDNIKHISFEAYKCIKYITEADFNNFLKFRLAQQFENEFFSFCERLFLIQLDFVPKTLTYLKTVCK